MFPPRAPFFFYARLPRRAAQVGTSGQDFDPGNLPVPHNPLPNVAFHATFSGARRTTIFSAITITRKNAIPSRAAIRFVAQRFSGLSE